MKPETYKYVTIYSDSYDLSKLYLYHNKREAGNGATEFQLAYTGSLEDIQRHFTTVYRAKDTHVFYLTRAEAAWGHEDTFILEAVLRPPYLKPKKLPITAQLVHGDRGLYTRLNLHPEIDGCYAKGKVFFPDRSCADDLVYGEAIITEVKDKGTYGFFKGHNVKYDWPTEDQLDAYIHANDGMWNNVLVYIETAHFGKVIMVGARFVYGGDGYVIRGGLGVHDGKLIPIPDYMMIEADKTHEVKKVEIPDLICQRYHNCSFSELMKKFVQLPQAEKMHRLGKPSDRYISSLMDEAADSSVVYPTVTEQSGVFFYYLRPDGIVSALSCFSQEEMDEIIQTVNRVNTTAIERIQSLIKRGKMRLDV